MTCNEFQSLVQVYKRSGTDLNVLQDDGVARLLVSGNQVLSKNEIPGIHMRAEQFEEGVRIWLVVDPGIKVEKPVHLCFGVLPQNGKQVIISNFDIGENARIEFVAHCTFPNAVKVTHLMDAKVRIRDGASMMYNEVHYHGPHGGVITRPETRATVGRGAKFISSFRLIEGQVGELDIDFEADVLDRGAAEFVTKVYGKGNDQIRVREVLHLKGEQARGLTKTNVVVVDQAFSDVYTEMHGLAAGTRGHMDCTEVVGGSAVAKNVPLVMVTNETAKITHEAAIGSVDRKQVETLMARGLTEDEAVDVVVQGLLR
ncbi:MAG: SufD family Fe-S cluster assembly protein [Anaerolineales bacterium]|nr:SufD family Fe-S cluster assembly protein [Anaerolineales bacterium]